MSLRSEIDIIENVRLIAKSHGYAIAIHGTLIRDIDLVAIPWIDGAAPMRLLLADIITKTGYARMDKDSAGPDKPHGRYAVLLKHPEAKVTSQVDGKTGWTPKILDISFVPCIGWMA